MPDALIDTVGIGEDGILHTYSATYLKSLMFILLHQWYLNTSPPSSDAASRRVSLGPSDLKLAIVVLYGLLWRHGCDNFKFTLLSRCRLLLIKRRCWLLLWVLNWSNCSTSHHRHILFDLINLTEDLLVVLDASLFVFGGHGRGPRTC